MNKNCSGDIKIANKLIKYILTQKNMQFSRKCHVLFSKVGKTRF